MEPPIVQVMEPIGGDIQYQVLKTFKHPQKRIYSVAYNHQLDEFDRFALAGGNMVMTYAYYKHKAAESTDCYLDKWELESFLAVTWACIGKRHYILAGGTNGHIRVIYENLTLFRTLEGHDDSITDIQCSGEEYNTVLSSSKDKSIRLWSIQTGVCLAKFCNSSHPLNSVSFHSRNKHLFFSSGEDKCARVIILYGYKSTRSTDKKFKTTTGDMVGFPIELKRVSSPPSVNCVRCLHDQVLSLIDGGLVSWKITKRWFEDTEKPILFWPIADCGTSKFEINGIHKKFALGNKHGEIYIFDVRRDGLVRLIAKASDPNSLTPIRQTTTNDDGSIVFSVNEEGTATIWKENANTT